MRFKIALVAVLLLVAPAVASTDYYGFRDDFIDGVASPLWVKQTSGAADPSTGPEGFYRIGTVGGSSVHRYAHYVHPEPLEPPFHSNYYGYCNPRNHNIIKFGVTKDLNNLDFGYDGMLPFYSQNTAPRIARFEAYINHDNLYADINQYNWGAEAYQWYNSRKLYPKSGPFYVWLGVEIYSTIEQHADAKYIEIIKAPDGPSGTYPVIINLIDDDTNLPTSCGSWSVTVLDGDPSAPPGSALVDGKLCSGGSALVYLPPATTDLHTLQVDAPGYNIVEPVQLIDVQPRCKGRVVNVRMGSGGGGPGPDPSDGEPVTVRVVNSDTNELITGLDWHLNILDGRASADPDNKMIVDMDIKTGTGEVVVNLPQTWILNAHWLHVEMDGYEQSPAQLLFDVPSGGRIVTVPLRPVDPPDPPEDEHIVSFLVVDADEGYPLSDALVNLGGVARYTGSTGTVWFTVEPGDYSWVATRGGSYWASGGSVSVVDEDIDVIVNLVAKESDLPRPPIPEIPELPVIHPSIDPAVLRSHILDAPLLGDVAGPFLDFIDDIVHGIDGIVRPVLDIISGPLRSVSDTMGDAGEQIDEHIINYAGVSTVILGAVGSLLSAFPDIVLGLISYGLLLDLVWLLLRGGM